MSEYKTLIAEIVKEFKREHKIITSIKINSELKKKHDIKLPISEVRKILEELESEREICRDSYAENEDENCDEIIESYKTYNVDFNEFEIINIPKDYYTHKFKNEKNSNGKYNNIVEFIINKFDLDFIPISIDVLIDLLPNVKEPYDLKYYSCCDKFYEIYDNKIHRLGYFKEKINIIDTYGYNLDKILIFVYSEATDKYIIDIIKEIYYNPLFKGEFELNAVELGIIVDYIANKDINGERLIKSLEHFRK